MKNTIAVAAFVAIVQASHLNDEAVEYKMEDFSNGLAQVNAEAEFIQDVANWVNGALEDAWEWTLGAFEDIGEWTYGAVIDIGEFVYDAGDWLIHDFDDWVVGAGQDIGDWFEGAAEDVVEWTVGAAEDVAEWTVGAGEDIAEWTVGAAEDVFEWTAGAAEDAFEWTVGAGEDIGEWFVGAGEDIGEWFVGAGEDVVEWTVGAGEDIGEWVVKAGNDIIDWSEGAFDDITDWTVNAGLSIADWTVEAVEDVGEFATDVFERMGEFGEHIISELEDMFSDVGQWVEGAVEDIGDFAEHAVQQISKLDEHFIALGELAADIYKKAENAVGDAAMELYNLGDQIIQECVKVGKEVEKGLKAMEDWAKGAIDTMQDGMRIAGQALIDLGEDFLETAAGQKIKIFVLGAVEEISQAAQNIAQGAVRLHDKLKTDGLHVVLADGIKWVGDGITHFATETMINEIGGKLAQVGTIGIEAVLKGIGMDEEGKAVRDWVQNGVEDASKHLKGAMEKHFEVFETLVRDPQEFVELIEEEPWRVLNLASAVAPGFMIIGESRFTYSEEKLREFVEYDEFDMKLPKGWLTNN